MYNLKCNFYCEMKVNFQNGEKNTVVMSILGSNISYSQKMKLASRNSA